MYTWNRHLKTLFSGQPLLLKLFVLTLLCLALFSINAATAQARTAIETSGASAVEVDDIMMPVVHYDRDGIADGPPHIVPGAWYFPAEMRVGFDKRKLDNLYHYCMKEENQNKPECRALHNPSPGL